MRSQARQKNADRHILICLSSSTSNAKVIHAAAKIAAAFQGTLTALFVETPAYSLMSDDDKKRLRSNTNLAEKLGAKLDTVIGDDVPYQIAEDARVSDISCVVIGQTNTVGGLLRRKKSLTDRLVAYAPDLDYFIIPDHGTKVYVARNCGKVLTHKYITQQVWGAAWENNVASLRVFMATLRKKLDASGDTPYIQTHVGIGYRMVKVNE